METVFLFAASAFFALQFIFNKLYEKNTVGGLAPCLWNRAVCSVISIVFLLIKTGAAFSGFSMQDWLYALLYSACVLVCSVASITAMRFGSVGAVGVFCLAGGMMIPFLYGVISLGEKAGVFKWLGMAILCASLALSAFSGRGDRDGKKTDIRFVICAVTVFFSNGFVSVFSKMHQILPDAADENGFLFLASVICLFAALVLMTAIAVIKAIKGERRAFAAAFVEVGKKDMSLKLFGMLVAFAGAYSLCNTLGNLFSLRCMVTMDASIQFPVLSAAVIVLTAVFGRLFFAEKFTARTVAGLCMSVLGIGLFMIP